MLQYTFSNKNQTIHLHYFLQQMMVKINLFPEATDQKIINNKMTVHHTIQINKHKQMHFITAPVHHTVPTYTTPRPHVPTQVPPLASSPST
jgi:hypothetical protein